MNEPRFPSHTRRHRLVPWLRALAGTCLAAAVAVGPAMAAGGTAAGASGRILVSAPGEPGSGPTAEAAASAAAGTAAGAAAHKFCLMADAGDAQVRLTWTQSMKGTGFLIYQGTTPDAGNPVQPAAATDTRALVTGLTNGTTYYFWLAVGDTVVSSTALATPTAGSGPAAQAPAHRFCLMADAGDKQARLTWTPSTKGTSFLIYQGTTPDAGKPVQPAAATDTRALVTGLINGTTYYFWLVADTVKYYVVSNNVLSNMAWATPATRPEPPTRLTATPDNRQVTLSWAAPASDGGSAVTGYNVYQGTTTDFTGQAPVATVNATSYTATGLVNGTTYFFQVTAVNRVGEGQPSPVSAVPATVPEAPTELTVTAGDARVRLAWTAPASNGGSQVSGYNVYYATSADFTGAVKVPVPGVTSTVLVLAGLVNGTMYHFQVRAVNQVGEGPASSPVSAVPVTVPGAPTGLTVTPEDTQVRLVWTAPASTGGSPVTGYDLYAGTTADFRGKAPITRVPGTVVTVSGLVVGTTYHFQVRAVNRVGAGPPSAEAKAVAVTVPGAPAGLTATPGNDRVTLSWAPPASDGGSPVSGYLIYRATSPGGETGAPVNRLLANATSYTVTGLAHETTYYFWVIAVNAVGKSPPSEASATLPPLGSSSSTPTGTPTQTGTSTPTGTPTQTGSPTPSGSPAPSGSGSAQAFGPPTGLTAAPENGQVHLSWIALTPDGGSSVISYKVYFAAVPGVQKSAPIGTTRGTDAIVAGLTNGTKYWFTVTAVNAAGKESPFASEVSATPTTLGGPKVTLPSPGPSKQLIALLTALGAMAVAAVSTLIARRMRIGSREGAHAAHHDQQEAAAADVRAVADTSRPDVVSVRDTGREPTHTVRLEPHPGLTTTTIKEGRP
jgi:hypothetical protein